MDQPVLRGYQEDAADFLYARNAAMVLAPVGAGKTAITLTALRDLIMDGNAKRALVVAPLRVASSVWPFEALTWAPELKVEAAIGSPQQRWKAVHNFANHIVTINYENLQWLADFKLEFDVVVFDELTRLKNPSGVRFKAINKIAQAIPIRWGLTGSFTSNGLEDVFGQCKIIDQKLLGRSKGAFLQSYFNCINKEYQQWEAKEGALEAVMQKIKPSTYVLPSSLYSLPSAFISTISVKMPDRTPYDTMKQHLTFEGVTASTAAVAVQKLQQLSAGFLYQEEDGVRWFNSHKMDALAELLEENQYPNTIVVYQYKEELAELKRRFGAKTILDDQTIREWNEGKVPLLAVHPMSAAHGLNLQYGGNHLIFLSLPWSLELYEQTIGRIHRSGQKSDVWVYVLMTQNSIDDRIFAALADKRTLAEIALEELKA
jgi:SNF2 family DNA or RNA helicase